MVQKRYLFTPGPTPVPPQVLAALSEPVLHHRAPDFRIVYERTLQRLQEVHRTSSDVLLFTCSGTGAFESAIVNLCSPGDRVLAVSAGQFGERWAGMARGYGCEVEELRFEWGETPTAAELTRRLAELEPVSLVFLVHSETSTGVVCDLQALAAAAKEAGALVVVDAVSSLGAVPLETDDWGLDVVVAGSQKALMTPPGLGTVAVSEAAWELAARSTLPRYYLDWERTRKAQAKLDSAFTPAVSLVVALDVALGLLLEEGLDAVCARHARLGRACRAGIKAMGLELFSPDEERSAVVTAAFMPDWARLVGADARAPRPARDHDRRRPGRAEGEDLPDRAHRLLRRVRHRDGAFGRRARARRARRPDRARAGRHAGARGVRRRSEGLRVLVRESIAEPGIELLRSRFHVDVDSDSPLEEIIERYDAIVVRSATKLDAELLERAALLKVIGRAGVGVDNVDVAAATRAGIVVANAPESTVVSAAEHTIGLLVALARNIPQAHAALKQGRWERSSWGGVELADKTLGVLGFGRIGRQVARRALGLGMRVVGYDPFVVPERFRELGADHVETAEEVLAAADFLTLHLPLTDETRGFLDAGALARSGRECGSSTRRAASSSTRRRSPTRSAAAASPAQRWTCSPRSPTPASCWSSTRSSSPHISPPRPTRRRIAPA